MGGSIHFDARASRWFVSIYRDGVRYRIFQYKGEPIGHKRTAAKLLSKIQAEIDDGTFIPKTYFPDSPLSIGQYSEVWLNASTACKNTKRTYRTCIKAVVDSLGKDFDLRNLTFSRLSILKNELPLTEKGKYNVLNTLKTMLRCAYKDDLLKRVPTFPALTNALPDKIEYLTIQQQESVLQAIPDRHRGIFELGMIYGLRVGEMRALKRDCVEGDEIVIRRSFSSFELRETTKTGEARRYPVTPRAKEIIEAQRTIHPFSPYLFPADHGGAYTQRRLNTIWHEACGASGISIKMQNAIRHSLGCQLLDEGVEMELVRDVYGHTSTQTTRRYAQRTPKAVAQIFMLRDKSTDYLLTTEEQANQEKTGT